MCRQCSTNPTKEHAEKPFKLRATADERGSFQTTAWPWKLISSQWSTRRTTTGSSPTRFCPSLQNKVIDRCGSRTGTIQYVPCWPYRCRCELGRAAPRWNFWIGCTIDNFQRAHSPPWARCLQLLSSARDVAQSTTVCVPIRATAPGSRVFKYPGTVEHDQPTRRETHLCHDARDFLASPLLLPSHSFARLSSSVLSWRWVAVRRAVWFSDMYALICVSLLPAGSRRHHPAHRRRVCAKRGYGERRWGARF